MTWAIIAFLYVSGAATMLTIVAGDGIREVSVSRGLVSVIFWPVMIWVFVIMTIADRRS